MPVSDLPPALRARLAQIRAISFDGDDTLWDFETGMLHALGCVLDELRRTLPGPRAEGLTVPLLRALRDEVEADMPGASTEAIRLEAMRRTLVAAGGSHANERAALALFELYVDARYAALRLYPDTQPAVDALGARYPLAVISNGNTDVVRAGLRTPFALVLFATEAGVHKPDPRIFCLACQRLGCAPHELAHVGDSLESDVAGAQAAGVLSIWLNRAGHRVPVAAHLLTGVRPELTITSLTELVPLLT
jgi:2-haloalkanoic acid dehalogenase type II